jgi:hypothetical protein
MTKRYQINLNEIILNEPNSVMYHSTKIPKTH